MFIFGNSFLANVTCYIIIPSLNKNFVSCTFYEIHYNKLLIFKMLSYLYQFEYSDMT